MVEDRQALADPRRAALELPLARERDAGRARARRAAPRSCAGRVPPSPSWPNSRNGSVAVRHGASGIVAVSVVPRAVRALDVEAPAERLDARAEALQPGAARGSRRRRRRRRRPWRRACGRAGRSRRVTRSRVGVLDRVRERLGDEEPDRGLDHGGRPALGQR